FLIVLAALASLATAQLVLPGGKGKIDVHDELLQAALSQVKSTMLAKESSPYICRFSKVLDAEAQIVNGVIYYLTVELGQTECLKSMMHISEACHTFTTTKKCHARIYSQPW